MSNKYIITEGGTRGIPIEVEKPKKEDFYAEHLTERLIRMNYEAAMLFYNAALEEAKKNAIPIVGAHPFKDGEVVDAKNFCRKARLKRDISNEDYGYYTPNFGELIDGWKVADMYYQIPKEEFEFVLVPIHTDTKHNMTHELKTWPEYFEKVKIGEKAFEVRKNDRNFQVGDTLLLKEWKPKGYSAVSPNELEGEYTGRELQVSVSYVLQTKPEQISSFGISSDTVVMSISPIPHTDHRGEESESFLGNSGKKIYYKDLSPEIVALIKRPPRNPCTYCGKEHLDYACDAQIQSITRNP